MLFSAGLSRSSTLALLTVLLHCDAVCLLRPATKLCALLSYSLADSCLSGGNSSKPDTKSCDMDILPCGEEGMGGEAKDGDYLFINVGWVVVFEVSFLVEHVMKSHAGCLDR